MRTLWLAVLLLMTPLTLRADLHECSGVWQLEECPGEKSANLPGLLDAMGQTEKEQEKKPEATPPLTPAPEAEPTVTWRVRPLMGSNKLSKVEVSGCVHGKGRIRVSVAATGPSHTGSLREEVVWMHTYSLSTPGVCKDFQAQFWLRRGWEISVDARKSADN